MSKVSAAFVTLICLGMSIVESQAECSPAFYMAKYVQSLQASNYVQFSFILAATLTEFDLAKKSLAGQSQGGIISESQSFDEAKSKATRVFGALKLNVGAAQAAKVIAQQLVGPALQDYVKCITIDEPKPGVTLWQIDRDGDVVTLGAYWLGTNRDEVGRLEGETVLRNFEWLGKPPTNWKSGAIEKLLLVAKSPEERSFISIGVNGSSAEFSTFGKLPDVVLLTKEIVGPTLSARSFRASGTVCGAGSSTACVYPTEPGGYLVKGTGRLTDYSAIIGNNAGFSLQVDTLDQACVTLTVSTGACEAANAGQGKISVLERYPKLQ
ncbi:hypothetical protein SSBR45G_32320 [Bradyrhizobium sp. SSBR45G]|uniref:hypothetical protein n=1 Tax=unclassified Bradyrhizobium TaxID=2631580 RepID=UPI002342BBE4|nr:MULTISPECIES: hypothetical protein [unclassified Bradyrhizobium]GLH78323.1 hypothetical protein SSBR45G_32320 [Bradyrhizobium sp. SSBR45G]GLH86106.1 hypothetical protein SSBR45R_35660 [Bradyrhizobium sp. SSBR45R]